MLEPSTDPRLAVVAASVAERILSGLQAAPPAGVSAADVAAYRKTEGARFSASILDSLRPYAAKVLARLEAKAPPVDPAKDALLMKAFREALAELLGAPAAAYALEERLPASPADEAAAVQPYSRAAQDLLRQSGDEGSLDTGDALNLLIEAVPHLPASAAALGADIREVFERSAEDEYVDSDDLLVLLRALAGLRRTLSRRTAR